MGTQIPKKVPMGTRVPKWGPIWEQCCIVASSNSSPSTQNKKLQLKTSSTSILISGCSNDLQNVEEQIDDVEVEVERSKDILLWVQRILDKMLNCINSFRGTDYRALYSNIIIFTLWLPPIIIWVSKTM